MPDLSGKVALVIGASLPGGRALAVALAEAGADVAVATRTPAREEEVLANSCANEIWAIGRRGLAATLDAADARAVAVLRERVAAELGRLDFVVEALS
jgi:7-alpha-hydroxysteroid dehydrogenase